VFDLTVVRMFLSTDRTFKNRKIEKNLEMSKSQKSQKSCECQALNHGRKQKQNLHKGFLTCGAQGLFRGLIRF